MNWRDCRSRPQGGTSFKLADLLLRLEAPLWPQYLRTLDPREWRESRAVPYISERSEA